MAVQKEELDEFLKTWEKIKNHLVNIAEVEGGETRFKLGPNAYIFSDKLTL